MMDVDAIGTTAGEIWRHLDANGATALSSLKVQLDQSETLILMGLGWLARENKIVMGKSGRGYAVWLNR